MNDKKSYKKLITLLFVMTGIFVLFLVYTPVSYCQNWAALPPYNTLWPLWSPTLAPVDSATGLPVPIVESLVPGTVLPVQPGLTWDPAAANPWLLYNTPLGMAYYDPVGGVNLWPPPYLLDDVGAPLPLSLPTDFALLPAPEPSWLTATVPAANVAAYFYLMGIPAPIFATTVSPSFVLTAPVTTPVGPVGPLSTTATPTVGPTFLPVIGGVPLFLSASALIPPPSALIPPPAPAAIAPSPVVPTPVASTPIIPIPTPIVPTPIAPTPLTTIVPPPATAPIAPLPTPIVPVVSGLFFPII